MRTAGIHRRGDVSDCVVELIGLWLGLMDRFTADGNGERGAQHDAVNLIMVSSAGVEVAKFSGRPFEIRKVKL